METAGGERLDGKERRQSARGARGSVTRVQWQSIAAGVDHRRHVEQRIAGLGRRDTAPPRRFCLP